MAGCPGKLIGNVMHQPMRGSTGSPLISVGPIVLPSVALATAGIAKVGDTMRSYVSSTACKPSTTPVRNLCADIVEKGGQVFRLMGKFAVFREKLEGFFEWLLGLHPRRYAANISGSIVIGLRRASPLRF